MRGRLVVPEETPRPATHIAVRVGDSVARSGRSGRDGRIEVRGKAIGAVAVAHGEAHGPGEDDGNHYTFDAPPVVLDGSGVRM